MKRTFFTALFVVALLGCARPSASERAVQFTTAAMSGEKISLEEWFAPNVGETDFVRVYGGPEKLSADSKRQADAEGGIKRIEVIKVTSQSDDTQLVIVKVTFNSGKATELDETWKLIDENWKLVPPENDGASNGP